MTNNNVYNIDHLLEYNVSALFLLRPMGLQFQELGNLGFVNSYLEDEEHPEYEGMPVVFLLFKVKNRDKFNYFRDREKLRTPHFIGEYDYEGSHVVMVYEFPLPEDMELIKQGKYSKVSEEYRKTILDTVYVTGENGEKFWSKCFQYGVVFKDPSFKQEVIEEHYNIEPPLSQEDELWTRLNPEKEKLKL